MSWTRAELKTRAKAAFYRNYWVCVLVAFILGLVGGGNGVSCNSSSSGSSSSYYDDYDYDDYDYDYDYDSDYDYNYGDYGSDYDYDDYDSDESAIATGALAALGVMSVVFIIVFLVVFILGMLLSAFVFNPFQVGGCYFFLENAVSNNASVGGIIAGFKSNYKGTVLTMFLRQLYTSLWTMLFIIPGVIKSYEYRMIPYILADHPEMDHKEAFALSKKMMDGEKWNAFVLDLSFYGWMLLSVFTCGILSIFYVNPYVYATNAELYLALKRNKCQPAYGTTGSVYSSYGSTNTYDNSFNNNYNTNNTYDNSFNNNTNNTYDNGFNNNYSSNNTYDNGFNNNYNTNNSFDNNSNTSNDSNSSNDSYNPYN